MEILTDEDKRQVLEALKRADELRREIERAKRAGIDVGDIEERLQEAVLQLTNIKRVYIGQK